MKFKIIILIMFIIIFLIISGCSNNNINSNTNKSSSEVGIESHSNYGAKGASQIEDPTLEQILIFSIQDEFFARSEYEYIINELGAKNPFSNIIKAEEKHINMLKPLFEKYNIEIPQDNSYDHIVYPKTITEALEMGVNAEINNIEMYEKFLSQKIPDDIRVVFEKLMNASKNHLEAFNRNLNR